MKILGIDYGEKKTGVAVSEGRLAEPLKVVKHESMGRLVVKLKKIVEKEKAEKLIVGVSEGEMGRKQEALARTLEMELGLPVATQDETLSTHEAQRMSIEAGKRRKRRREMEDAYAAAVMLQRWVDENL